jgi:hypothetical protein
VNVVELTQRIEDYTRHAPNVNAHTRSVRRSLSESYRDICETFTWPFLVRKAPLWMLPDLELANAAVTRLTARSFSITNAALVSAGLYATEDAVVSGEFKRLLPGALFDLTDTTLRADGNGNWPYAPFEVEFAADDGTSTVIFLDPRCDITTLTGDEGTYTIKFPRYQLPVDAANVIRLRNDDGHEVIPLRPDEVARLDDRTGQRPSHWYRDEGLDLRFPPWALSSGGLTPATPQGRTSAIYGLRNDAAWKDTPFTATSAGAGSMATGQYEVFVAWWYAGRLSPPSPKVTVSVTGSSISLTSLPALADATYGRRLTVWVGQKGENGPYYLASILAASNTTTASITAFPPQGATVPFREVRWDEVYRGGTYHYIRPWPRPVDAERFELEYVARYRPLVADTDAPEFDEAFHDVLVYDTVFRLASQPGGDEKPARSVRFIRDERMRSLRRRYGVTDAHRLVRAPIDGAPIPGLALPEGLSINWQGS